MGIRLSPNNPKNNSWRDDYPMTYLTSFSDDRTKARKEQMTDISSMTDEQLNEALAIEVMGWKKYCNFEGRECFKNDDDWHWIEDWQPTRDLNQAVMCAEKLYYRWRVERCRNAKPDEVSAEVWDYGIVEPYFATCDNPARALCEAVLMAVRGEGKGFDAAMKRVLDENAGAWKALADGDKREA